LTPRLWQPCSLRREILAEGEAEAQVRGFAVTTRQEANRSSIWKTILDVADEVDASLIVAGTHGTTAVESGLLGSVSNALVHHAHRPVLLVPTPEQRPPRWPSSPTFTDQLTAASTAPATCGQRSRSVDSTWFARYRLRDDCGCAGDAIARECEHQPFKE
jgi:Universal stress protein family